MRRKNVWAAFCAVIGAVSLGACAGGDDATSGTNPDVDGSVDTATVDSGMVDTGTLDTGTNTPETGPTCATTETLCDGKCVDTSANRENCGGCGKACDGGKVCAAGACLTECPAGQKLCGALCVSTDTDSANCGACGKSCAAGEVCSAGSCTLGCAAPLITCTTGGGDAGADAGEAGAEAGEAGADARYCANPKTDRLNCGTCGTICPLGNICVDGSCTLVCGGGATLCAGSCRDFNTDPNNCGSCGNACATGEVCNAGTCALSCGGGTTLCSGACRDFNSDPKNCGMCGKACATGEVCNAGTCALSCGGGTTVCSGLCRDLASDAKNCGMCGKTCAAGEVCSSGTCGLSCGGGTSLCSGTCRDLASDAKNCGTCGKTCAAGEVCSSGTCSLACGGGSVKCTSGTTSVCTNLASDPLNCSSCGAACPARAHAVSVCAASTCGFVCSSGYGDCNATASDGCEATLASDNNNCGKCGNVCSAGKVCTAGACTNVGTVLIYHDSGDTLADDAVTALGGTPKLTTDGTAFNTAFDAGGFSAIIWDSPGSDHPAGTDTRLQTWIAGGGRLVYSFWHLKSNPTMAAALGVNPTVEFSTFRSVYVDSTTVNFWTYFQTFPTPLTGSDQAGVDGDELTLTGAGFIAGRFDSASGPGSIAVTHAGRVVVDGFLPWDTRAIDNDGDGVKDMNEMFQNQLLYVLKN